MCKSESIQDMDSKMQDIKIDLPRCNKLYQKEKLSSAPIDDKENLMKCAHCPKIFSNKKNKRNHELVHTGKSPHRCKFCDKLFGAEKDKRQHEHIHTGYKPHKCQFCDKCFNQPTLMYTFRSKSI